MDPVDNVDPQAQQIIPVSRQGAVQHAWIQMEPQLVAQKVQIPLKVKAPLGLGIDLNDVGDVEPVDILAPAISRKRPLALISKELYPGKSKGQPKPLVEKPKELQKTKKTQNIQEAKEDEDDGPLDPFTTLPPEVLTMIFHFLDPKSVLRIRQMKRSFMKMANEMLNSKPMCAVSVQIMNTPEEDIVSWNGKRLKLRPSLSEDSVDPDPNEALVHCSSTIGESSEEPPLKRTRTEAAWNHDPKNEDQDAYLFTSTSVNSWPRYISVGKLILNFNFCKASENRLDDVVRILKKWRGIQKLKSFVFKNDRMGNQVGVDGDHVYPFIHHITSGTMGIIKTVQEKPLYDLTVDWFTAGRTINILNTLLELQSTVAYRPGSTTTLHGPFSLYEVFNTALDVVKQSQNHTEVRYDLIMNNIAFRGYIDNFIGFIKALLHNPRPFRLNVKLYCPDFERSASIGAPLRMAACLNFDGMETPEGKVIVWHPTREWEIGVVSDHYSIIDVCCTKVEPPKA